jgi:hypothetical protein
LPEVKARLIFSVQYAGAYITKSIKKEKNGLFFSRTVPLLKIRVFEKIDVSMDSH